MPKMFFEAASDDDSPKVRRVRRAGKWIAPVVAGCGTIGTFGIVASWLFVFLVPAGLGCVALIFMERYVDRSAGQSASREINDHPDGPVGG